MEGAIILPSFQSGLLGYRTNVPIKLLNSAVESNTSGGWVGTLVVDPSANAGTR